ncbi:MAG: PHP domain-containing protein [Deltaproteobacteria bacterium]|jgi:predicted metal-dependent phosphoesterase TrpH|nr:PHP domain-containing protein [Deltaproteobacteria bacterium]
MLRLDLHTHSTASDGTFCPRDLIRLARRCHLAGLALCDHDTVDGLEEFIQAGSEFGLPAIGGVELSLEYIRITHLLGLGVKAVGESAPALKEIQKFRSERNNRLFEKLAGLGIRLDWERLLEFSHGGQLGRPHFARAMMEAGFVSNIQQAFDRYLGKGRPAYVDKVRLRPQQALEFLRKNGFAPVLAHPISLRLDKAQWLDVIPQWKEWGLIGLEAFHPDQEEDFRDFIIKMAKRFKLVVTAGSDYHGANKKTPLTWVRDNSPLGLEVITFLREALDRS